MKTHFKIALALGLGLTSLNSLADVPVVQPLYDEREVVDAVEQALDSQAKKDTAAALKDSKVRDSIARYMQFLQIDPKDDRAFKNTLNRLLESSTQMLLCQDLNDWACLEKKSQVVPTQDFRRDVSDDLGKPVDVKEPLQIEYYFTSRYADLKRGTESGPKQTVADVLGQKITQDAQKAGFLAFYGIDDTKGSMAPVFNAIAQKVKARIPILGVFDVANEGDADNFVRDYNVKLDGKEVVVDRIADLDFSYVNPEDSSAWVWGRPDWMNKILGLDPKSLTINVNTETGGTKYTKDVKWLTNPEKATNSIRLAFQYKGTPELVRLMNTGITDNSQSRARIEYPMDNIMHNKFAVLDDGSRMSVWTGTTNVARTCMGDETNSNMAVYIKNTTVAQTFLTEFREMFEKDPTNTRTDRAKNLVTGRFHNAKRPNTKRYFRFSDGHEMRVHFAPTDDGEHRSIIPMLLSAKKGDHIRVAMFGAGGIEFVRAFQYAAAQGAKIQIALDNKTGSQSSGWMKEKTANLFDKNPYSDNPEPIEVRLATWKKNGQQHNKTATLSRLDGKGYRTEVLIVGSQNWSSAGNDTNDENMVTLRHLSRSVEAGDAFNREFDQNIWALADVVTKEILAKKKAAKEEAEREEKESAN